jgi:hypothetical protein
MPRPPPRGTVTCYPTPGQGSARPRLYAGGDPRGWSGAGRRGEAGGAGGYGLCAGRSCRQRIGTSTARSSVRRSRSLSGGRAPAPGLRSCPTVRLGTSRAGPGQDRSRPGPSATSPAQLKAVDAFVRAGVALTTISGTFNIGTGLQTTTTELHQTDVRVGRISSRPQYTAARTGEIQAIAPDYAAASAALHWRSNVDMSGGVQRTVSWLRDDLDSSRPADSEV